MRLQIKSFATRDEQEVAGYAELLSWFHAEREAGRLHPLLLVGLWVVVFLEIHPFQDGNGRLSRVLVERGHLRQQGGGRGAWYELR